MKNLAKILMVISVFQFACSKDDDGGANGGTFVVNGTTYELTKGFLVDEGGEYDIILTSPGISLESDTGDDFIGIGDYVSIVVISSSSASFEPGTFVWSDDKAPGTIEDAGVGVNYNLDTDTADLQLDGTGGTATVSLSGTTYTITFSITTDSGIITGSYRGPLTDAQD